MSKGKAVYISFAVAAILVSGGLFVSSCNSKSKDETPTSITEASASTTQSPSVPSSSDTGSAGGGSKIEQAYVEVLAQNAYHAQTKGETDWGTKNDADILAQYGVTEEDMSALGDELRKDPARAQTMTDRYTQRLAELQKAGN